MQSTFVQAPPRNLQSPLLGAAASALGSISAAWAEETAADGGKFISLRERLEQEAAEAEKSKIDLGEFKGEGPWQLGLVVFIYFMYKVLTRPIEDMEETIKKVRTEDDDYFNPDFDPYKNTTFDKK